MDVYHAVIIVLLILILWIVWKKCGKTVANAVEGLIIPNSAGPVSTGELKRLVKGGIPLSSDQYLMKLPVSKMARLGVFNPDQPTATEGFTMTNGVDVTGTDLQRQLYTGLNAADRYTVKPRSDGYLVGGLVGGTSGLADGLIVRERPRAVVVRGGAVVKNPYASQNVKGPSMPMR